MTTGGWGAGVMSDPRCRMRLREARARLSARRRVEYRDRVRYLAARYRVSAAVYGSHRGLTFPRLEEAP